MVLYYNPQVAVAAGRDKISIGAAGEVYISPEKAVTAEYTLTSGIFFPPQLIIIITVLELASTIQVSGVDSFLVAPSPRILAYLARKGRLPTTMALATVDPPTIEKAEVFEPPPPVVVTPCDPWPRPYYLEDGLRKVYPYHFTYNTWCKQRWRGREILEIFADEFRDRPVEYYVCAACV